MINFLMNFEFFFIHERIIDIPRNENVIYNNIELNWPLIS